MTILYTGNKITVEDAEDMISVSDLDGDGRINFVGASISLLPSASPTIHCPATFVIQSSSRYMQFALFLRFT